jgi:GNAT superfamily N-acetyltransferase
MEETVIRKYKAADRSSVRDIAWETAFIGEPADIFFSGKDILADFLTLYFTDYEPQSCFVAENKTGVVGYLIGAKNTAVLYRIFLNKILARLLYKFIFQAAIFRKKNLIFIFHFLCSFSKFEFRMVDLSEDYPATMHINIKQRFRNLGIGSRLISAYFDYLRAEKVKSVYLATLSEKAAAFFMSHGFNLLYSYPRSYFKYILGRDLTGYIYGKKLI